MDAAIGSIITTTTIPSVGTSTGPFIDKPTVLAVQKALITKGYSVGKSGADGLWGKDTAQGIKSFQGMRGETQTGVINIQLCNALGVAVPGARTDVTVSAAAQDVANVANNAAGEAAKADTPAAVKDVAKVVETAAVAQPPAPPAVQAEVKKAVAQAQAAKTPEEVKLAAAAVSAAGVSVAKAAVAGWWVQPAWVGAPLKRWHAVAGAGAAVALSTVLIAVLRRKK